MMLKPPKMPGKCCSFYIMFNSKCFHGNSDRKYNIIFFNFDKVMSKYFYFLTFFLHFLTLKSGGGTEFTAVNDDTNLTKL